MLEKEITVFPKPFHGLHLRAEGETWDEVNKQLLFEYERIKHTLPLEEQELVEKLLLVRK